MIRKPIVSGQFYESDFNRLDEQLNDSFVSKKGPGALPNKKRNKEILAAICPHAGFVFSGQCAAWAYKEIAESKFPDLFIILGPSHYGSEGANATLQDFETPLGVVKTDTEFVNALVKKRVVKIDDEAHASEHSIEVQLPFLQFSNKDRLNDIRIVPITLGSNIDYKTFGLDIKELLIDSGKKAVIIASSDFTHYGPNYGYVPFSSEIQKRMYELDAGAINYIKRFDTDGFLNYCFETGATICGQTAIAALLNAVKAKNAKLLQYYTSGDISGDYRNAVGYAAIVFE